MCVHSKPTVVPSAGHQFVSLLVSLPYRITNYHLVLVSSLNDSISGDGCSCYPKWTDGTMDSNGSNNIWEFSRRDGRRVGAAFHMFPRDPCEEIISPAITQSMLTLIA